MYSRYSFTMERDRRRTLIQAIVVCSVLIYSVNCDCILHRDCVKGICDVSSTKKCICTYKEYFGEKCEKKCDEFCNIDNLHCQVINRSDDQHTVCVCKEHFVPKNLGNILEGCKPKPTDGCETEDTSKCKTCKEGYFGTGCIRKCDTDCTEYNNLECRRNTQSKINECQCLPSFKAIDEIDILKGCFHQTCSPTSYCKNGGHCYADKSCDCRSDDYFGDSCEFTCATDCNRVNTECMSKAGAEKYRVCNCTDDNYKPINVDKIREGCYPIDDCREYPKKCKNKGECNENTFKCECAENSFGHDCGVLCNDKCKGDNSICEATNKLDERTINCKCKDNQHIPERNVDIETGGCYKDPCNPDKCQPGGTCEPSDPDYKSAVCKCTDKFFGTLCNNKCEVQCDPTKNLKCVPKTSSANNEVVCDCINGQYRPKNPDKIEEEGCFLDPCVPGKCQNGGTCTPSASDPETAVCECTDISFGVFCENKCEVKCDPTKNLKCIKKTPPANNEVVCNCTYDQYRPKNPDKIEEGCFLDLCRDKSACTREENGACTPIENGVVCTCNTGFYGQKCEHDKEACKSDICKEKDKTECTDAQPPENKVACKCITGHRPITPNTPEGQGCIADICGGDSMIGYCINGICNDDTGIAVCDCSPNYFGANCDEHCTDRCQNQPNTKCTSNGKCICENGYVENTPGDVPSGGCRKDPCDPSKCQNGGTCTPSASDPLSAICKCPEEFFGKLCEKKCEVKCDPTKNLKCIPKTPSANNEVVCNCTAGKYRPKNPDKIEEGCFLDLCHSNENACTGRENGVCIPIENAVVCTCNTGFYGLKCEHDKEACKSDICKDKDKTECTDAQPPENKVACKCIKDHRPITPNTPEGQGCIADICGGDSMKGYCNNGTCDDNTGIAVCDCSPNYFGAKCDEHCTDRCQNQPNTECTSNGVCKCEQGYAENTPGDVPSGGCRKKYCETHSCANSATCSDFTGFAKCHCAPGFFGKNCSDSCNKLCEGPHLVCLNDTTKPVENNAVECVCKDATFTPIDLDKIPTKGCRKDTCKNNQCDPIGTLECQIVNDNDHRCKCKPNYYGIHCNELCGTVCTKPNLVCEYEDANKIENTVKCICKTDYKEMDAEAKSDGCAKKCDKDTDCGANATCTTTKVCKCDSSYSLSGDICFPDSAPCPCRNGGQCIGEVSKPKCKCAEGFAGAHCEIKCDSECGGNAKCEGDASDIKCTSCNAAYTNVSTKAKPTNCVFDICQADKPCKHDAKCEMLVTGDYSCECQSEYKDKNCTITCEDECGKNTTCNHNDTTRKTYCTGCVKGFLTLPKQPKSECVKDLCENKTCLNNGTCKMVNEMHAECECPKGFSGENCECEPIDCKIKCPHTNSCIIDCNSYSCVCNDSAQEWVDNKCVAFDECKYKTCGDFQHCKDGKCECKPGHKSIPEGKCEEKVVCESSLCPKEHTVCVIVDSGFECRCKQGYYLDRDLDKCQSIDCKNTCPFNSCDNNGVCTCPTNFKKEKDTCVPINDTCKKPDDCKENMICLVATDADKCVCKSGYEEKSSGECTDINECAIPEIEESCKPGKCENVNGTYKCACEPNVYNETLKTCMLVDECTSRTKPHNCDLQSTTCENQIEGFKCNCITDYHEEVNKTHCKLRDMCEEKPCSDPKANCQNNVYAPSGRECICPLGQVLVEGSKVCQGSKQQYPGQIQLAGTFDSKLTNSSSQEYKKLKSDVETALSETLMTSAGKPVVVKVVGFREGSIVAEYVVYSEQPLTYETAKKFWHEQCHKLADKESCVLGKSKKIVVVSDYLEKNGTQLIENKCYVAAESACAATNAACSPNPTVDQPFQCTCKPGYEEIISVGGLAVCSDIDECKTTKNNCKAPKECKNLPGTFECGCKSGFTLVGEECKENCKEHNPCVNGKCKKLDDGWQCECDVGYEGAKCDKQHSQFKTAFMPWQAAVGVLAAALVFCLIISCLIIRKLKKKLKHNAPLDDSQLHEYSSVGQSKTNLAPRGRRTNEYDNAAGP